MKFLSKYRMWVLLFAVVALYMTWTFDHELWNPDETRDAGIAAEMFRDGDYVVPHLNGEPFLEKPPLYYWSAALIYKLTGVVSAGTTRLPAASYGILGVVFTFLIGQQLFGVRVGILAASFLATSAQYFRMSHFAMMDVPLATLVAGALYFYLRDSILGFVVFSMAAFYAKGFLGIVLPGIVVVLDLLIQKKIRHIGKIILWGILGFIVLGGPWLYGLWLKGGESFLKIFLIDNHWTRFVSDNAHHSEHFWFFYLFSLPVDFLPWSLFFIFVLVDMIKQPQRYIDSNGLRFVSIWFFGLFLFFTISSAKRSIYALPLFPAVALLSGVWVDRWIERSKNSRRVEQGIYWGVSVISILIILSSFFVVPKLDEQKSFTPIIDAIETHRCDGDVIGYNLNEMERGVFGFYLERTLVNPITPEEFSKARLQRSDKPYCLILKTGRLSDIRDRLPLETELVYKHRPHKSTRSYLIYAYKPGNLPMGSK